MSKFQPKIFKNKEKKIIVFLGLCKGCGLCIEKCPQKAIKFSEKDRGVYSTPSVAINPEKCNLCQICEISCPDSALKVDKT